MFGKSAKISVIPFNSNVQLVHGYNFYIVGQGHGNYDSTEDPSKFNLEDPPERNTVVVPAGGWVAIRFKADNPGK